jgi:glycyl-tRNA synthetase beta subunit
MEIDTIKQKVNEVISRKLAEDVEVELSVFFKEDIDSKLKRLKSLVYREKYGTYYDKTNRLVELSKFLSFWSKNVDINLVITTAKLSKIGYATYLTKIAPELSEYLTSIYAKINNYSPKVIEAMANKDTQIGNIINIANLVDKISLDYIDGKNDCDDKIDSAIIAIIKGDIDVSLTVLILKSMSLYKKKKNAKKIKEEIIGAFKRRFIKIMGVESFDFKTKNISLNLIYKSNFIFKDFAKKEPEKAKCIKDLNEKLSKLAKPSKFSFVKNIIKVTVKKKNKSLSQSYKNFKKDLKKVERNNYTKKFELLSIFSGTALDYLSNAGELSKGDMLLMRKIKKTIDKII